MADQTERFARQDSQIDAVERLDRAELDPDPARGDDRLLFGFHTHALATACPKIHGMTTRRQVGDAGWREITAA
jgi:hypothetical protein